MKAIVYAAHGGPEVLQYKEVPEPQIGALRSPRPRARLRPESPRSLAPQGHARIHTSRCRTFLAATSPVRSPASATKSRA